MIASLLHPAAHKLTSLPGQPPHTPTIIAYVLLDVFLIVALARILGNVMTKIGQPRVVGEILAGVLLGPTLLGADLSFFISPAEARPILSAIATIALVLFMFLAGVEYDTEVIRGRAGQAGTLAVFAVAIPALLGFPVAALMHNATYAGPKGADFLPFALFIGAALAVTAFPVMAHILMERGQLNSKMGGLGVASTGFMSILMFLFIAFAASVASKNYSNFGLKVALTVAFLAFSWLVARPALDRFMKAQVHDGSMSGNGMAVAFAGMILWGLAGDRVGINALVGGFIWGVIMPQDQAVRHALAAKVRDVAMIFLLPIFFAFAGYSADLKLIHASTIGPLLVVLVAAVGGKFLAAVPAKALGGLTWQETGTLGALFNTRGLLVLVAGLIGLQATIITPTTFTIIVVMALVTNLMTLPLLNLFSRAQASPEDATPEAIGSTVAQDGGSLDR
jgi:Kef-type K+ transport system membrane component KefB